jgi:hypothetical protein
LLAHFDPALDLNNALLVSLDPAVSYQLGMRGYKYRILEDFYDEKELRAGENEYFSEQLKWFDLFDQFLQEHIVLCKEHSIPLAKTCYVRIKYCIDTILTNVSIFKLFFSAIQRLGIQKIVYVHEAFSPGISPSVFYFMPQILRVLGELLSLFSEKYSMAFLHHSFSEKKQVEKTFRQYWMIWLKQGLKLFANAFKFNKILRSSELAGQKFFFMHAGGADIDIPIRETLGRGASVMVKEHGRILMESSLCRSELLLPGIEEAVSRRISENCVEAANILARDSEIIRSICDQCNFDISPIIVPFLRGFVLNDAPVILESALKMHGFFMSTGVDYVFARANSELESLGPLIAAKYLKAAQSVCLGHASFAVENKIVEITETQVYNITFARDPVSESFLENSLNKNGTTSCRVTRSMHFLKTVRGDVTRKRGRADKKTIVYVPKKLLSYIRPFNNMPYSLTWYYEFQKKIIDFFLTQKEFKFIYKHAESPTQLWAKNSTLNYIRQRNAKNIAICRQDFPKVLRSAGRVIIDYPSGALFEAAAAGAPILCLYADYLNIIPMAQEIFGKCLQPFSSVDQAIDIIREFLDADPKNYQVDFPIDENDFLTVFENAIKESADTGDLLHDGRKPRTFPEAL